LKVIGAGLTALAEGDLTQEDTLAILNILKQKKIVDFMDGNDKDFEPLLRYVRVSRGRWSGCGHIHQAAIHGNLPALQFTGGLYA
jgi:hypothetical protein